MPNVHKTMRLIRDGEKGGGMEVGKEGNYLFWFVFALIFKVDWAPSFLHSTCFIGLFSLFFSKFDSKRG